MHKSVQASSCSSEEAVQACLERIGRLDGELRSFVSLRPDQALNEARILDAEKPRGPLHGVPFAAKDVFDTGDLPTEYGSPYYHHFQPAKDAVAVSLLRDAGAVLLGKTATVEFAGVGAIPDTRNPFNLDYSPGGSSAGSGAAVGAGLVPLALATQTGGSTIRPGSFCGVAAFKPTWGRVSVEGLKPFAPGLDTVGWIAEDAALLEAVAAAYGIESERDSGEEKRLRIGFYRTPYYDEAMHETLNALEQTRGLLERAGHAVEDVPGLPGSESLNEWQDILMHGEGRTSLLSEYRRDSSLAHKGVRDLVENRKGITPAAMIEAYDCISALRPQFDKAMSGFDAWLTPAVPGIAPRIEDGNGLATFNRLFTALHVPCVTLPGFTGPNDLPVGIQLVAPRFADSHLLHIAKIVEKLINRR